LSIIRVLRLLSTLPVCCVGAPQAHMVMPKLMFLIIIVAFFAAIHKSKGGRKSDLDIRNHTVHWKPANWNWGKEPVHGRLQNSRLGFVDPAAAIESGEASSANYSHFVRRPSGRRVWRRRRRRRLWFSDSDWAAAPVATAQSSSGDSPGAAVLVVVGAPNVGLEYFGPDLVKFARSRGADACRLVDVDPEAPPLRAALPWRSGWLGLTPGECGLLFGSARLDMSTSTSKGARPPVAPNLPGRQLIAAVLLREPLSRLVAHANHLRLDKFSLALRTRHLACNQQTSIVNGVPGAGGVCGEISPSAAPFVAHDLSRGSCASDPAAALAMAVRRLEGQRHHGSSSGVAFVGVFEDLVGSAFLLQQTFGWGPSSLAASASAFSRATAGARSQPPTGSSNTTSVPHSTDKAFERWSVADLAPEAASAIRKVEGRCDGPLWARASALLSTRLATLGPRDRLALNAFRSAAQGIAAQAHAPW